MARGGDPYEPGQTSVPVVPMVPMVQVIRLVRVVRWSGGQVVRWSGGQVVRWSGGQVGGPLRTGSNASLANKSFKSQTFFWRVLGIKTS